MVDISLSINKLPSFLVVTLASLKDSTQPT